MTLIKTMGNLNILLYHNDRAPDQHRFPSWVPDFGNPRFSERVFLDIEPVKLSEQTHGAITTSEVSFSGNNTLLHSTGKIVGQIIDFQPLPQRWQDRLTKETMEEALASFVDFTPPKSRKEVTSQTSEFYLSEDRAAHFAVSAFRVLFLGESKAFGHDLVNTEAKHLIRPKSLLERWTQSNIPPTSELWLRMYWRWARHAKLGGSPELSFPDAINLASAHVFNGLKYVFSAWYRHNKCTDFRPGCYLRWLFFAAGPKQH
ncbi:uncharacterized protein Z518_08616 [Rhinocladiella mackenziei CBS 650.93]|uniref:Rhinocladiella mackenziei CBS 650.93 unplaced genomic scaffold supercont1.6, whole genome shotgun sequence n=1 Tax=Rhinocladiella mackenziei CBS 650.93 TaxID=1442369 RepID=A0A0D2I9U4_9EURO|nr:uncharacterized protein Z518_08616 [Rhinocladiella mackenziei CBS 650.93]KIX02674.1 hypothetical protein Z518_08616 [Rhinocladiella mackenziei CBS 650.93]